MIQKRIINKIGLLTLLLTMTVACSFPVLNNKKPIASTQPVTEITLEPTSLPEVILPIESPTPPLDYLATECPTLSEFESTFVLDDPSEPFALCFLYPGEFTVNEGLQGNTWYFHGEAYGTGEMNSAVVEFRYEPAEGLSLEQYVQQKVVANTSGITLEFTPVTLEPHGVPALMTEGLPGVVVSRTLFIVHNDTAFTITFMPLDPPNFTAQWSDMERAYTVLTLYWAFTR